MHAIFATLVPGFPSPYPNMGLTALAALTPEPGGTSSRLTDNHSLSLEIQPHTRTLQSNLSW